MVSRREFLQAGIAAALPTSAAVKPEPPIKHVIVLMLENRSFDHMFAKSGIPGLEIPSDARPEMDNDHNVVPPSAMGQISGDKDGGGVDPEGIKQSYSFLT